jgi:hypothetical protein
MFIYLFCAFLWQISLKSLFVPCYGTFCAFPWHISLKSLFVPCYGTFKLDHFTRFYLKLAGKRPVFTPKLQIFFNLSNQVVCWTNDLLLKISLVNNGSLFFSHCGLGKTTTLIGAARHMSFASLFKASKVFCF